ncbi:hypothetical protein BGY98DRAFT_934111 [Russula aff. rugulosa BPL654]|nr:hypothetical protein BGY98DRAFT_934111 [Russula aff. rugulosa BPL654]
MFARRSGDEKGILIIAAPPGVQQAPLTRATRRTGGHAYATLTEAWDDTPLEPAPITPFGEDSAPWQLLSGTIKATFNAHRGLDGADNIFIRGTIGTSRATLSGITIMMEERALERRTAPIPSKSTRAGKYKYTVNTFLVTVGFSFFPWEMRRTGRADADCNVVACIAEIDRPLRWPVCQCFCLLRVTVDPWLELRLGEMNYY